jgi:hypothetical protein
MGKEKPMIDCLHFGYASVMLEAKGTLAEEVDEKGGGQLNAKPFLDELACLVAVVRMYNHLLGAVACAEETRPLVTASSSSSSNPKQFRSRS